jgi:hypothetical protein
VGYDYLTASDDRFGFGGDDQDEGASVGMAGATEVALGMTVMRGLVVGFGAFTTITPGPAAETSLSANNYEFRASQLAIFAPFVDYYIFERGGLHAQGGVGISTYVMGQGDVGAPGGAEPSAMPHTALGFGIMLGVGYEWWVAEEWSVGALGRMTRGFGDGDDSASNSWEHDSIGWALLMSVTNH